MADITMPQLGETVTEGTITKWFKNVGDAIAEDEVLFEVSTDKVDSEVPSTTSGVLAEIRVPEGETVDVGVVLAVIAPAGSTPAAAPAEAGPPAEPGAAGPALVEQAPAPAAAAPACRRRPAWCRCAGCVRAEAAVRRTPAWPVPRRSPDAG